MATRGDSRQWPSGRGPPRGAPRHGALPWLWASGRLVVPARRACCSGSPSAPATIGARRDRRSRALSHLPLLDVHSHLSRGRRAILWQLRAPRVVLGAARRRRCSRSPAPPTRACSATRSPTRTCSASRPARASARRSRSPTLRGSALGYDLLPLAAFVGALVAVVLAYVARPLGRRRAAPAALILAGVTVDGVPDRDPDVRPAAAHRRRCRRSTLDPRPPRPARAGTRSRSSRPYIVVSAAVLLLHRRMLDVLSVGDEEAASLGVNVRRARLADRRRRRRSGRRAAVAVSGLIGFVGIIVPHSIRLSSRASYRAIVPALAARRRRLPRARATSSRARCCRRPSCRSASSPRSSAPRSSRSCCARAASFGS